MIANASLPAIAPVQPGDAGAANEFLFIPMRFLPRRTTTAMRALARLGGLADDIVNAAEHEPSHKTALLDGLAALLDGAKPDIPMEPAFTETARDFAAAAAAVGGNVRHAQHILQARRQDIGKSRYRDWNELLAYCRYAASPYGRFGLDIAGADKAAQPAAEALCGALQILLLLRDCGPDYRVRGRVYLPERWFKECDAAVAGLGSDSADGSLRQVFMKTMDATDRLLATARPLPGLLRDRHLRAAAATMVCLVERFARRLRFGDPLARRLAPTAGDRRLAVWRGYLAMVWR